MSQQVKQYKGEACSVNISCNVAKLLKVTKDKSALLCQSSQENSMAQLDMDKNQKFQRSLEIAEPTQLCVDVGAFNIPRQDKVDYGGEDAFYVSDMGGGTFGVADGVGSWNEAGINPGEYSRLFMKLCQEYIEEKYSKIIQQVQYCDNKTEKLDKMDQLFQPKVLREALNYAHMNTKLPGSSTACILALNQAQGKLYAANIGDSGFQVIRNQKVIFKSPDMQHFFDCPYQLGFYPKFVEQTDTARDAQIYEIDLKIDDIIVVATDGLWDNVSETEIARQVSHLAENDIQLTAEEISTYASDLSKDQNYRSPYVIEAQTQGVDIPWWQKLLGTKFSEGRFKFGEFIGGKQDDITVIVAKIVSVEQKQKQSDGNIKSEVHPPTQETCSEPSSPYEDKKNGMRFQQSYLLQQIRDKQQDYQQQQQQQQQMQQNISQEAFCCTSLFQNRMPNTHLHPYPSDSQNSMTSLEATT